MSSCVSATRIQVQQLPQQVACFCQPRNACDTDATISHSLKRHMRDYLPSFCSLANNHPSFCNQDGDLSVLHCTQFLWPTTASSLFEKFGCVPGLVGLAPRIHFRRKLHYISRTLNIMCIDWFCKQGSRYIENTLKM